MSDAAPTLFLLENPVQHYAWGSRRALSALRGQIEPASEPEAEIWMGAHPSAPSRVVAPGVEPRSLRELILAEPARMLGERCRAQFGDELPFLLKLLAADEPLSLQAHPSAERARSGFAREEALGIPRSASQRRYRDPHHKPELICALTPFSALVGFRHVAASIRLFDGLGRPELAPLVQRLEASNGGAPLASFFAAVFALPAARVRELSGAASEACRQRAASGGEFAREYAWGARIGELYPGDPGLLLALLLNLIVLEPGQALFLPAGKLHAYLEGTGVELMASSDNVLRGGLTSKHVDVAELSAVLDFRAETCDPVGVDRDGNETLYRTAAREFALSRLELAGRGTPISNVFGPEIVTVTHGTVTLRRAQQELVLTPTQAAFVAASGGDYRLEGTGTAFRARLNDA